VAEADHEAVPAAVVPVAPPPPETQQTLVGTDPAQSTPPAGTPVVAPTTLPTSTGTGSTGIASKRRLVIWGAIAGAAVLIVGVAVGATLALSKGATTAQPSYASQASRYLTPVLSDNTKLAFLVALLGTSGNPSGVTTQVTTTQADVQTAQDDIDGLKPMGTDVALANQVKDALSSETAWLQTASAVLANTSSPELSQLSGVGLDAQTKFSALGQNFRVARHATFPASEKIVAYASANNTTAQDNQENLTFSNQVLALLNQSTSAFTAVNTFYGQLQDVANGGFTDLTLPQAEQQINAIVSSRTSLAAAAQALNAPTPQAQSVASDLVAAFNDSLKDDNDLASCLNEANDGTEAFIFGDCLSASSTDNTNATADKQTFLAAYNQLRSSVGQPPTSVQF
jgi:hypothetical protein